MVFVAIFHDFDVNSVPLLVTRLVGLHAHHDLGLRVHVLVLWVSKFSVFISYAIALTHLVVLPISQRVLFSYVLDHEGAC